MGSAVLDQARAEDGACQSGGALPCGEEEGGVKANRRSILAMIGMAPAAATLDAGNALGGISTPMAVGPPSYGEAVPPSVQANVERSAWARAILDPDRSHTLRMLVKGQIGTVTVLDPDIAAKRSWSMSVKVAEQRRRYIDQRLAGEIEESSWTKMRKIVGL